MIVQIGKILDEAVKGTNEFRVIPSKPTVDKETKKQLKIYSKHKNIQKEKQETDQMFVIFIQINWKPLLKTTLNVGTILEKTLSKITPMMP